MTILFAAILANPCAELISFSWPVDNPSAITFVCAEGIFASGFEQ